MTVINTAATAAAAFIEPVEDVDPDFLDLMEHLCTFEKMGQSVAGSSSYGHRTISRETVVATYEGIRCRLRSLTQEEVQSIERDAQIIDDMVLYVPLSYMPRPMRDAGQAPFYRLVNVRTLDGSAVEAGPFNIKAIRSIAGEQHHYLLNVRKVS